MAREQNRGMGQSDHTLWSVLKRAHKGVFHKISPKHLQRYVTEFAGKLNARDLDTLARRRRWSGVWRESG